ncbi:MAG: hypothetical protein QM713_16370 [Arachnia sp.]
MTLQTPLEIPHADMRRRTVLKAGAWAAPTIAVAAAAPLAAASVEAVDLAVGGRAGAGLFRFNADNTRYVTQSYTTVGEIVSSAPTPGCIFSIQWDERIMSGFTLTLGGSDEPITPTSTGPIGTHGQSATFVIGRPIPVATLDSGEGLAFELRGAPLDTSFFPDDEDLHPFVIYATPGTGSDPDLSNNGWTSEARYGNAWDVAVISSAWTSVDVLRTRPEEQGGPYTDVSRMPTSMTIMNIGAGEAPVGSTSINVTPPSNLAQDGAVSNLSVTLNGVPTPSALGPLSSSYSADVLVALLPGDLLEVSWDLNLRTSFPADGFGIGNGGAGVQSSPGDIDGSNNYAIDAPEAP